MTACQHVIGAYYCLEVDPEKTNELHKVAFYNTPPVAMSICLVCNRVIQAASTEEIGEHDAEAS